MPQWFAIADLSYLTAVALRISFGNSWAASRLLPAMSSYNANGTSRGRPSDWRREYSANRQPNRVGNSKVPGQEDLPQGLNEDYYRESAAALGIAFGSEDDQSQFVPMRESTVIRRQMSPPSPSSRSSSGSRDGRLRTGSRHDTSKEDDYELNTDRRARSIQNNFSQTRAGIGAGIVGAVVGGLAANQASEAAFRRKKKQSGLPRRHSAEAMPRIVSTVLGAVAGSLGANAITHKVEDLGARRKHEQVVWERKRRHRPDKNLPNYHTGRGKDMDYRYDGGDVRGFCDYDQFYGEDRRSNERRPRRQHRIEEARY